MVNKRIICEPDSYGRTTDLPKTWPARSVLTPIYKYTNDNWIWVWLKTLENCSKKVDCIVKSSFSFWVTKKKKSKGRIIHEPDSYRRTMDLPKTQPTWPVLTPVYKYAIEN